jgi:hypothetical protein
MTFKSSKRPPAVLPVAAALAALAALAPAARADRRAFGVTYEYNTMPEGGLDLELWNTQSRTVFDGTGASTLEWKAEVEYGITDHWDLAVYQTFGEAHGSDPALTVPFGYAETSVESRYRLAERGQWPVDVLLYLEVAKQFGADAWDVEPKLILARDLGRLSLNLNAAPELQVTKGPGTTDVALEPRWALGASYEIDPRWKVGAETYGEADLEASEVSAWAGPAVSWAPSEKLWIAGSAGAGLTDASDDLQVRLILGLGL